MNGLVTLHNLTNCMDVIARIPYLLMGDPGEPLGGMILEQAVIMNIAILLVVPTIILDITKKLLQNHFILYRKLQR
ncbi:hypothetical protein ACFLQQ_00070 [Actinomycetota bacterium]